jgi:L-rhamnose isomerase
MTATISQLLERLAEMFPKQNYQSRLERYLDSPYYLTRESITVFTERKSFELYMFSDDIRKFGLIKAMNEREKDLDSQKSD